MTCTGSMGTGASFNDPTSVSIPGDQFSFELVQHFLMVPTGSTVGTVINTSGTMTFSGTLASLGFTAGTTSCTWGGGTQSVTISVISTPAPAITSLTPTSGNVAGGGSVTITGTNLTGATAVSFGGTAATSFTVDSATQITATVPAHAAGAVAVAVTTPSGTGSLTGGYTYVAAPTVTSLNTTSGPLAGGASVTITGTNLTGATAVTFGGTAATSYSVNSATQITATVPAHAAGASAVAVTTPGGTGSLAGGYTYIAAPTVASLNISSGPISGSTNVTITGTNLTGATAVSFGGTAATSFTVNSATQITATTPAHAAGAVSVLVTTVGGTNAANSLFTYASATATLSSLNLSSGTLSPAFAGGTISYTASVSNATSSITVTPTVTDSNSTVKVNGTTVASGSASASISLNVGSNNTITTVVTAQDGITTQTYTTTVTRAAAATATLSGLSLSSGTLSPAFGSNTTSYTATVTNATTSITVTPTVTDNNATVKVNGTTVASGSASGNISLSVGSNTITTVVTAQDGTTTQTYTTTVTRAALIAQAALTVAASPNVLNATTPTSTLSTSGGSGSGAVSYAMTAGTCTLSGATVTAGSANETCTVTATKAADGTYTSATATVAISVSRRATLAAAATDASVAKTQGTQLMQTQKFVQTQMLNITSHLDTFRHSFALTPSNLGVSVATPSLGPMAPLFYKIKDVWSGNSGESTTASLRKAGMKDPDPFNVADKQPFNDYNNPQEIDQQAAMEERIYAYERKQETYSFWTAGTIDTGLFKTGDNKDVTNKFRVNGLTFGLDYKVGPRAIVGAAVGLGYGTNASPELQSAIKSTQRSYTGYGMLGFGDNWVVDGLLGYSALSFGGDRTTSDGLATLDMSRTGSSSFASTSISKIFSYGAYRVAPFVREDLTQIRLGQYTETGSADYALGYASTSYSASTTSAGLHLSHDLYLDHGKLTSSAKLSSNRLRTGAISQDVYYVDAGVAGGIYTLMQGTSYQTSRSLNLGLMYTNKAGDGIDLGWMGAMGANQYRLNGLRFGARFAM